MPKQAAQHQQGQAIIEYLGSLVLTAIVVAVTWQICHYAMPGVFSAISNSMAGYYHSDTP